MVGYIHYVISFYTKPAGGYIVTQTRENLSRSRCELTRGCSFPQAICLHPCRGSLSLCKPSLAKRHDCPKDPPGGPFLLIADPLGA